MYLFDISDNHHFLFDNLVQLLNTYVYLQFGLKMFTGGNRMLSKFDANLYWPRFYIFTGCLKKTVTYIEIFLMETFLIPGEFF